MVRAPCCEKMGLKKGPWTPEEDHILVSHIQSHGHSNWRALPKQAGLLRCGKSCRLRWTNYLRPDIKRGNFTKEEEEAIIELHNILGNRWSTIAARLPGRTDNEIKNVWHTHLKKRLKNNYQPLQTAKRHSSPSKRNEPKASPSESEPVSSDTRPASPQPSSSELSSVTDSSAIAAAANDHASTVAVKAEPLDCSSEYFPQIDESFWSEELSTQNLGIQPVFSDFPDIVDESKFGFPVTNSGNGCSGSDFWYNLFLKAEDLPGI